MRTSCTPTNDCQLPPQACDAEEAFLSACLMGAAAEAVALLSPADFYRTVHQIVFATIVELSQSGHPVDSITVIESLKAKKRLEECGGASTISRLVWEIPAAGSLEYYAEVIKAAAMRRDVIVRCHEIARSAYESGDVDLLLDSCRRLSQVDKQPNVDVFTSYAQLAESELGNWEKIGNKGTGIPSGFAKLDAVTGGFQDTDLIILAARPAMGKSALMVNISEQVAASIHPAAGPVAVFSLEMSKSQLYARQTSRTAKVDSQRFRLGGIQPAEWGRIVEAQEYLHKLPVYIDDSALLDIREIERRSRLAVKKYGVRLIIVDHLQKIRSKSNYQRKDLEVGDITGAFKAMAKNLSLPVILLCQLNRTCESRDNKRPRLSDLRESGAIEQDADVVMFLYRDEYYYPESTKKGIAELEIAKQRNGPTGTVFLTWIPWRQSFETLQGET